MHDFRDMMTCNALPVCNSGRAVLVAAAVAAVRISLYMADQDRKVRVVDSLIHPDGVAALCFAEVNHIVRVLGIMTCDLTCMPELVKKLRSEDRLRVLLRASWMQAVRNDELYIFLYACFI